MIRDAVKSVTQLGACPEVMWPYDPTAFRARPPGLAYQVASWHKAVRYQRVAQDLNQIRESGRRPDRSCVDAGAGRDGGRQPYRAGRRL